MNKLIKENAKKRDRFPTGIFTISLDFELLWGSIDRSDWQSFQKLCAIERQRVVGGLLDLFAEFELPATWCTVGHLFLEPRSAAAFRDRLRAPARAGDPRLFSRRSAAFRDSEIHARDLVERICHCRVPQEIGAHGFTHLPFTDSSCTREVAESELSALDSSARTLGLSLRSFVYPRNRIAHADLLAKYGYSIFRCQDTSWHHQGNHRGWKHRFGHAFDIATAALPPAVMPSWHPAGIWQIPGSMLFTPSRGVRAAIPVSLRVTRARKGLEEAAATGRVFHLWFHPTDLAVRAEAMLDGLRQVLEHARSLREAGKLEFRSMESLAQLLAPPETVLEHACAGGAR